MPPPQSSADAVAAPRSVVDECVAQRTAIYRTLVALTADPDLANDLAQEVVLRGIERADQYRGPAPVGAWLHRIAINAWTDHLRRRRIRRLIGLDRGEARDAPSRPTADPDDLLDVRAALSRLPARQRAAIVLRYYQDYDYASIGQALGVTAGSAGAILSRALDRLRSDLGG